MNEDYRPWRDVGDDPNSLMQTREVWGMGMEELDPNEWNIAAWDGDKPVFGFHKTLHRITYDPDYFTAEEVQALVGEALDDMKKEDRQKRKPKGFG